MALTLGNKLIAGSFKSGASWEVGDIGQSALGIDESLNKRRYLNGQVISQTQFAQFTAWLKQRVSVYPSLAITEADWQTAVTNSDLGQCGQFVIDDVNSTIRLPKVVNLQGLMDLTHLGETVEAGLPNITGRWAGDYYYNRPASGCVERTSDIQLGNWYRNTGEGSTSDRNEFIFDASLSNPIYGNSTTVQPESVQYPYFIQVAEGIENSVDVSREIELNNPFSLLDYKFSEYEITNASWLRSNGQFNSGTTYADVYNLLLQIYNGTVAKAGVSVKLSTETYADTDFVLNTTDTTFRLPLKVALASGKAVAGNGKALVLTDGTNNYGVFGSNNNDTIKQNTNVANQDVGATPTDTGGYAQYKVLGLAENSNVETSANGLYLYFYVGAVVQDASVIAAASVLTDVANIKNGVGFSNTGKETIVGWGAPDYTTSVSRSINTDYTATEEGYVWGYLNTSTDSTNTYVQIDGVALSSVAQPSGSDARIPYCYRIGKGSSYRLVSNTSQVGKINFCLCKGVN